MFRQTNLLPNPASVLEHNEEEEDSFHFFQNNYDPEDTKNELAEPFSIKARKFKEIQFLREMNARTNNNVENAHIQNMYYRDLFYDHGDTEPVKPKIPSYVEEMGFDNREYLLSIIEENKRAVSDKEFPGEFFKMNNDNKLRTSQNFRIKKDNGVYYEGNFVKNETVLNTKRQLPSQNHVSSKSHLSELSKEENLLAIYKGSQTKRTARSKVISDSDRKDPSSHRNQLPPKAQNKPRPQSKDTNRFLYLQQQTQIQQTSESRPNTTNAQINKRVVIHKGNNQLEALDKESIMQNRLKEFDDNIIFENLDFSPSETPTSQMNGFLTGKTTLAPMEISARNTGRSVLTNSDTKLNANALQIVDLPQKDNRLKVSNRVVQPLNRTIERVHSVHSDQRKPNPENEFDRKRKNNSLISKAQGLSMLKENENTISMNEGKPATDREKSIVNIRSDSPDLPIINETKK